jgi:hypothetical protein
MRVVLGEVVGNTRDRGVHVTTTEGLVVDNLTSGRLDKGRTGKEDTALVL